MISRMSGALLAVALSVVSVAEEGAQVVPVGAMLGRLYAEQLLPFAQYCQEALPQRAGEFQSAYGQLRSNLEALAPELEEAAKSVDSKPVSQREFDATMDGLKRAVDDALEQARQLPVEPLCERILARVKNGTIENLRGILRQSLADYQARLSSPQEPADVK